MPTVLVRLIRKPKSSKRRTQLILEEVTVALNNFVPIVSKRLDEDVDEWDDKPKFNGKVYVSGKKWVLTMTTDKRTNAGKHYFWVDKGTGERGGGQAYEIVPKKEGGRLGPFMVPHSPITMPNPSIPNFPSSDEPHMVAPFSVHAPGIYPRNFIKTAMTEFKPKFRLVVEAAIKRGLRKN